MAVNMNILQNALTKNDLAFMARCLEDIANEIDDVFPFQANCLKNMSRTLVTKK